MASMHVSSEQVMQQGLCSEWRIAMQEIDKDKAKDIIDPPESAIIVEVLNQSALEKSHLPDAISVPLGEGFDERVQQAVPNESGKVL